MVIIPAHFFLFFFKKKPKQTKHSLHYHFTWLISYKSEMFQRVCAVDSIMASNGDNSNHREDGIALECKVPFLCDI